MNFLLAVERVSQTEILERRDAAGVYVVLDISLFLFLKTLLTPELQNFSNRKGEIATKAELEINS